MSKKPSSKGPEFIQYFGFVLDALRDLGSSGRAGEVCDKVAELARVSDEQRSEMLPSGTQSRFENQVHWSRFYLSRAGLVGSSKRGVWNLTDKGLIAQLDGPASLKLFGQVQAAFKAGGTPEKPEDQPAPEPNVAGPTDHRVALLEIIKGLSASGFERLCQRLLRESGFEEVVVTGKSGDGGIDGHGVLQINALVSFRVLFQCKRYVGNVSAGEVRDFRGAMSGRTEMGIILTTGGFTPDAQKEAFRDGVTAIELVNSEKLVDMFEKLELGLRPRLTYDVDPTFFEEFR